MMSLVRAQQGEPTKEAGTQKRICFLLFTFLGGIDQQDRADNGNRALLGDCDVCILAKPKTNSPLSEAKQVINDVAGSSPAGGANEKAGRKTCLFRWLPLLIFDQQYYS